MVLENGLVLEYNFRDAIIEEHCSMVKGKKG